MKPGDRIGDYEIISELGRGGMGRVYKVRNTISDRIEAMKILLPELTGRQELVARFLREIKLVASLDHPNIGALRTALTLDDQLIMIMEFVEGTSLADYLDNGPLPISEVLTYTDQVLQALSHAHARGVVHRDIKPANMMLTPDGTLKVMDFGIAFSGSEQKLTQTGTTLGSLAYMSPEQVRGEMADPRSDLYSLGISVYEMVTGTRPFKGDSDFAIMAAHVKESPRPPMELQPDVPAALNNIILMAIAKEKEQRFQSAEAFRAALGSVGPVAAPTQPRGASRTSTYVATPMTPVPTPAKAASGTIVSHPSAPSYPAHASAEPPPMTAAPPPAAGGNRGLYMGIGAVLAIAVLVAAGTYYSSSATGSDAGQTPPAPATSSAPASTAPAPQSPAPSATDSSAAAPAASAPAPASSLAPSASAASTDAKKPPVTQSASAPAQPPAKPAEKPAEPDNSAALAELETQIDQLTTRALAVDSSLETLRRQQRASGFDLRADMSARQESMKLNLEKAREAFQRGDHVRGKRFADLAETAVGALEKFIGR